MISLDLSSMSHTGSLSGLDLGQLKNLVNISVDCNNLASDSSLQYIKQFQQLLPFQLLPTPIPPGVGLLQQLLLRKLPSLKHL
ncbi:unnamed protein product, partial [Sphagnum troendelagicum]